MKGPQWSPFLYELPQLQCKSAPPSCIESGGLAQGSHHSFSPELLGPPLVPPQAMPRLQVGIGRPTHRDAVQAYVLGRFSPAEQELLPPVLERAVDLLLGHIHQRSRESSSGP